ncbi:histone-lysine N-methyltransferase, H3 lysine-79 specific-like isoform X2 [Onthophagus taurus]|uniref:histone-lysine N-methyltransferase, H3 lysine-79 specific-like isoform X2 n=1 Tax=Onthophagus taurus TaxID=166361 RepID=UPI0039BE8FF7
MTRKLIIIGCVTTLIMVVNGIPPPGYKQKPQEPDPNPPKYEYGYKISSGKGEIQEKKEARDGIYALGRYYVKDPSSSQRVEYLADDWGYHPYVEYSSVGPHSKTSTQLVLGKESVIAQQKNRENNSPTPEENKTNTNIIDAGKQNNPEINMVQEKMPVEDPKQNEQQQQVLVGVPENLIPQQVQLIPITQQIPIESLNQVFFQPESVPNNSEIPPSPPQLILVDPNSIPTNLRVQYVENNADGNIKQNQIADAPIALQLIKEQEDLKNVQNSNIEISNQLNTNNYNLNNENSNQENINQFISNQINLNQVSGENLKNTEIKSDINTGINTEINTKINPEINVRLVGIKETSPLFENGAEISENIQNEEAVALNLFGQKIKSNSPSKLIESTKNLISEMDVLNINDAADVEDSSSRVNEIKQDSTKQNLVIQNSHFSLDGSQINAEKYVSVSSTTPANLLDNNNNVITPLSLLSNPIIVEDFTSTGNGNLNEEENRMEVKEINEIKNVKESNEKEEVVVTPRPGTKFLAPITAGVQLQNVENTPAKQKILVEIQKSIPYYVGKYEYAHSGEEEAISALDHYKLGASLISFPITDERKFVRQKLNEHKHIEQQLIEQKLSEQKLVQQKLAEQKLAEQKLLEQNLSGYKLREQLKESKGVLTNVLDQQEEQGSVHNVQVTKQEQFVEELPKPLAIQKPLIQNQNSLPLTKYIDRPYPVHVPYPVETVVEKYINRPYPVHVPVHIPVTIEKQVRVPYPVEKIIEKPVETIVEKPIPQPYPVEKIIEKPVPVEVTKFVDRPYPVQIGIPQPYPVETIVEKVVNKPYPVAVQVPVLIPQVQETKLTNVQVPVAQAYHYLPQTESSNQQSQKVKQYFYSKPFVYVSSYQNLPKNHQPAQENRLHLNYANPNSNNLPNQFTSSNTIANQYIITPQNYNGQHVGWNLQTVKCNKNVDQNEYIGLVPPKDPSLSHRSKKRQAKQGFESPRMEYGFLPPLIPSQEIDEQGRPINS